jgi:hypothetical protein
MFRFCVSCEYLVYRAVASLDSELLSHKKYLKIPDPFLILKGNFTSFPTLTAPCGQ